ncbi:MAG: acetyl-CoA acetyltransferase [Rhodospirillales bacterium]|jgi:acetyl-CoA acetyltransferase|nr:thiolase [Rhodospirillaceae bacterium]MDP6426446.1 acetyl-CoA acetyltransferase [Rhodospirillales bacterium]MDP6643306.1 acetyl-CoA acetyltransferase [Rhodospirillales bacterium]
MRGKTAIVGAGLSEFGEVPGWSHFELMAQSVERALADAGLRKNDIDGVFAVLSPAGLAAPMVVEYLGLHPKVIESTMLGGSSFVNFVQWAALALDAGLCDVALVTYGSNSRSGRRRPGSMVPTPYESIYGMRLVDGYALAASRHMHQYGTTREQLAEIAVAARAWAAKNPKAMMRDELTLDEVLAARMVSDPLTVLDCCLITDGGGALIMTRADRAKDFPQKPAYLLGVAAEVGHDQIAQMEDLTVTGAARSGPRAYQMAGLGPSDIDVLELYDAFTINTLLFLEDLGFCKKGEGGGFVAGGTIGPGGSLPVNTNGGGLSCVHPGMYGIFLLAEAVEQLRGNAGMRQIEGAQAALVHGNGGILATQVTAILGAESTL